MTPTRLVLNFREALVALLPFVERVDIPWRSGVAYENWDRIATAVYESLVAEVVSFQPAAAAVPLRLVSPYDMILEDYREFVRIEVTHPDLRGQHYLFHSFETKVSPFDTVVSRKLTTSLVPVASELREFSVSGATFRIILPEDHGGVELTELVL